MEHKQTTVTFNEYRYDQLGETHDEAFYVGDEIVARTFSNGRQTGKVSGPVVEILVCERRGLYQLKTQSGWCAHPRTDEVEVTKPYHQL